MTDIYHNYRAIFIHVYKTGGTSIVNMLGSESTEKFLGAHASASEIEQALARREGVDLWKEYFTFSFVRNPFTLHASLFFYVKAAKKHKEHQIAEKGFPFFIEWVVNEGLFMDRPFGSNKYLRQVDFIRTERPLDFIGRTENFDKDISYVCNTIGAKNVTILHQNVSPHKIPLIKLYDDNTIKLIQDTFEEDFIEFEYPIEPYWIK